MQPVSRLFQNMINKFQVYCTNREYGCTWKGGRSDLILHRLGCDQVPQYMILKLQYNVTQQMNNLSSQLQQLTAENKSLKELVIKQQQQIDDILTTAATQQKKQQQQEEKEQEEELRSTVDQLVIRVSLQIQI